LNQAGGFLTSPGEEKGAAVFLAGRSDFQGSQDWEVFNQADGGVLIRSLDKGYYLAPKDPEDIRFRDTAIQSDQGYSWALYYNVEAQLYHITTLKYHNGLALGAPQGTPSLVEFQFSRDVIEQEWKFIMVGMAQQPRTHCRGPWRVVVYLE
jgi:hypothetical protein